MSYKNIRKLPSAEEIVNIVSLSDNCKKIKAERDKEIKKIITGESDKFLVIIGPCSADSEDSVLDYVSRLAEVQEKVQEKIIIIPRIYTNKPRTTGEGYKGMLHQPNPEKAPNLVDGIMAIRKLHVKVISETGLTSADEMLYPDNIIYCEDLLSYHAIGARSVENQEHRLASSILDVPVGMKNPTSGDLSVMFNAIYAAQAEHNFIYQDNEVQSTGNPLAHAIMRGSVNKHGDNIPNYHYEDLIFAVQNYQKRNLANPTIVVDTNHSNSRKCYYEQPRIAKEILHSRKYNIEIEKTIRGLLIESYIEEGNQNITDERIYGKSITDSCLGWNESEKLIYHIAENI